MTLVTVGAGATGGALAGYLAMAGQDVWLLDPYAEHMKKCRENGLILREAGYYAGTEEKVYTVPVKGATTDGNEIGPIADVVLFMPKGPYTRAAMENVKKVSKEGTVVLTLQNGLGNIEIIEEFIPRDRIACGMTSISSGLPEPGVVTPRISPVLMGVTIGPVSNPALKPMMQELVDAFNRSGLRSEYTDDVMTKMWEKFTLNTGVNAVNSILRMTPRNCASFQDYVDIEVAIIKEVELVAEAEGIHMDPKVVHCLGDKAEPVETSRRPDTYASMAQDALHKRKTEIMNMNGYVSMLGKKHGIPTPYNDCITKLVRVIENAYDRQF